MEKIIVIVGPTGSGKTKLGINIAKNINGVLINADAFQVYKEITIGTAKALKEELDNVQIYNNDCISIYDE
jgi:tRNA dimethylallyltransferase